MILPVITGSAAGQMFKRAYLGDRHVTFQTCLEAYGNNSWGRLFIIAVPKSEKSGIDWADIEKYQ